jgi:prepilin-type N-terminal cleavage/methylation domain-containing protein
MNRECHGFSFLELLIVIAILLILQVKLFPVIMKGLAPPPPPIIKLVEIEVPVEVPCKFKNGDNASDN